MIFGYLQFWRLLMRCERSLYTDRGFECVYNKPGILHGGIAASFQLNALYAYICANLKHLLKLLDLHFKLVFTIWNSAKL